LARLPRMRGQVRKSPAPMRNLKQELAELPPEQRAKVLSPHADHVAGSRPFDQG
jgi:hypothetical protein